MIHDRMEWILANIRDYDEKAYQRMYDALSLFSKKKADSAVGETHRRQRTLAYFLLERLRPNETIGKEEFLLSDGESYSISHSGNHVAVAVREGGVGIDLEDRMRSDEGRLKKIGRSHFFTPVERKRLAEADSKDFFLVWTFKEAMTKLTGTPLARMLGEVDYYLVSGQGESGRDRDFLKGLEAKFVGDDRIWEGLTREGSFRFEWKGRTVGAGQWSNDAVMVTLCSFLDEGRPKTVAPFLLVNDKEY